MACLFPFLSLTGSRTATLGLSVVLLLTLVASTFATDIASADALWARFKVEQSKPRPVPERREDQTVITRGYVEAMRDRGDAVARLLQEFIDRYPEDPRCGEAVAELASTVRFFIVEIGDVERRGWDGVRRDPEAGRAWKAKVDYWLTSALGNPRWSPAVRQRLLERWVENGRGSLVQRETSDDYRLRLDQLRHDFPHARSIIMYERIYLAMLRSLDPPAVNPWLASIAAGPISELAAWAEGELRVERARVEPMVGKATALDGRVVDLAALRGKVVLIEYWATWCGPCIAELPTIRRVYDAYHERGFEIIGISLDNQEAKARLTEFVTTHSLPWPQVFEGKGWRSEWATNYAIQAIPAMFLLDREGRIASLNARGPKLEQEVRRLLGPGKADGTASVHP